MNAAQIGPPGTGKTESLATIEGFCRATKKKCAIIDVDGKARDSLKLNQLFKEGLFERFDPGSRLVPGTFSDRIKKLSSVPSQPPMGFTGYAAIVDELEETHNVFCAAVLDTTTTLEDHMKRFISFTNRKATFEFAEWNNLLQAYKELFTFFYSLPIPLKIINMHSMYNRDEFTGRVDLLPKITGSFKDEAGLHFSEFYFCFARQGADKSKPPEYLWRVTPDDRFNARSNVFAGKVDVPQNWEPVWRTLL